MIRDAHQLQIQKIANHLGILLSSRSPRDTYLWDGHSIGVGGLNYSHQLHEIAHWQVATPQQRTQVDFGLGPGPETGLKVDLLVSPEEAQHQEELASLLGIAYEAALGLNYLDTLRCHSWEYDTGFFETIQFLTHRGLLSQHLPTTMIVLQYGKDSN